MGDSTFRYPPGAPGVRDGGTRPGNRGGGSAVAGDLAQAGGVPRPGVPRPGEPLPGEPLPGEPLPGEPRPGEPRPGEPRPGEPLPGEPLPGEPRPGGRRSGLAGVARRLAGAAAAARVMPAVPGAPAVTYWRRRFVVLAVALATLAAAAWSVSEAFTVQPDPAGPATTSHGPSGGAVAPQGGGSHSGAAGPQHGSASGSPGRGRNASRRPSASPSPGAFGGFKPKFCSWHSIVLSASADQVEFASGQRPSFSLSVVSTQPTDCSFNVGPGHLALVVKEGPARIWSSADCVTGTGSLITALRRGVPTVVAIGWNKETSTPGCGGPARSAPAGTYTAYAVDGSLASAPVTFRLR